MRFYVIFKGAEVSEEGEKKRDYGIDAEIKALTKESFANKVHPTDPFQRTRHHTHSHFTSMHLFKRVDLVGEPILF